MSAYTFVTDASKIYFYSKDKKIHADIDDKTMSNVDNMSFVVSNNLLGDDILDPIPLKLEVFKSLITSKLPVRVKINKEYKDSVL